MLFPNHSRPPPAARPGPFSPRAAPCLDPACTAQGGFAAGCPRRALADVRRPSPSLPAARPPSPEPARTSRQFLCGRLRAAACAGDALPAAVPNSCCLHPRAPNGNPASTERGPRSHLGPLPPGLPLRAHCTAAGSFTPECKPHDLLGDTIAVNVQKDKALAPLSAFVWGMPSTKAGSGVSALSYCTWTAHSPPASSPDGGWLSASVVFRNSMQCSRAQSGAGLAREVLLCHMRARIRARTQSARAQCSRSEGEREFPLPNDRSGGRNAHKRRSLRCSGFRSQRSQRHATQRASIHRADLCHKAHVVRGCRMMRVLFFEEGWWWRWWWWEGGCRG